MKKVLILSNHFATIYKFRRELVEKLVEKGYEVVVSLPKGDDNKEIEALGVRIIETDVDRKSLNPIKDIKLFLDYLKIIKKEKPDIAIGYTIKPNIYGGMASRIRKTPFIANVTGIGSAYYKGGMLKKIVSTLYKVGLKKAKSVFFENVQNAQVMIDDKTITKEQAVVMNGAGVNLERFSFSPMPKDDITKFLFVGRVMEEKGVNELFDAIKKIADEGPCILVGRCADYALESYKNVVSVFIHADLDARIRRIARIYNLTDAKAKDMILKTDKKRAGYYNYYTNKKWSDSKSYELCLTSSELGIDGTANAIIDYVKLKESIAKESKRI